MSIKYICDICGKESNRDVVNKRMKGKIELLNKKKVMVEIIMGLNNSWNDGNICLNCGENALLGLLTKERSEK